MMHRRFRNSIIFGMMIIPVLVIADENTHLKMDSGLRALVHRQPLKKSPAVQFNDGQVSVYILAEGRCQEAILRSGGTIYTDLGDLVTANVPLDQLETLASDAGVKRLSLPGQYRPCNDHLTADIRADQVYAGADPLPQSYTGAGVIIGIIDTGIDISHPDFKKSNSKTRILSIWDQNISGTHPPMSDAYSFDYGHEWTQADIDNGLCTHEDQDGHGTHVAGIAAGNGRAAEKYRGVAPEADLIFVADNPDFSNGLVDAVNYIYKKAQALGKPCVINASLGSQEGPHDGSDLESRMLDQLISESPGRAFCASAGNEGNDQIHMTYPTSADSFYTYVHPGPNGKVVIYLRIPNELTGIELAVGWDDHNYNPITKEGGPTSRGGKTPWFSVRETLDNAGFYERANWDGLEIGRVSFEYDSQTETTTLLRVLIEDDVIWDEENETVQNMNLWRFMIWKPDSRIDAWVSDLGFTFQGEITDVHYIKPDNRITIGIPAVARKVIAVGATVNRETFTDQFGTTWSYSDVPAGQLADFSSQGPTADGRLKPEIVAPGHGVISSLSESAKTNGQLKETDITEGGRYMIRSGTSMSCPAVAGTIALYLQQHPEADHESILQKLTQTARQDDDTGIDLPNNLWGYGKTDALALLSPGSDVNISGQQPEKWELKQNSPNPFNLSTCIRYTLIQKTPVQIQISSLTGQIIIRKDLGIQSAGHHQWIFEAEGIPSGEYICILTTLHWKSSRKMILIK
jgi:minor extracellular serine protease Vpr